jgi:hypothetical protein
MKILKNDYRLAGMLLLIMVFFMGVIGCVQSMTPKKQLTMMYGTYNSQYSQYMTDTGYIMDENGEWKKSFFPAYTEDEKNILRKKKEILTQMYPLIKVYDSMVVGVTPYSSSTEQELMNLIDQLAKLGGV